MSADSANGSTADTPDTNPQPPELENVNAIPDAAREPADETLVEKGDVDKEAMPIEAEAGEAEPASAPVSPPPVPSPAPQAANLPWPSPSILYCVPANVLDITSGAALSQRTLLASLAARGFRAVALEATVFDSAHGGEHILKAAEIHKDKQLLRTNTWGVDHIIIRTAKVRRPDMTSAEVESYLNAFRRELKHRRPDMVFMWGGLLLEMTMMREAREAGIPVVFYLVNGGYKNKETFKYASVVVTDTEATAKLYKERLGLDLKVVGKFIDPQLVKSKVPRRPDFITFINPSFEKGVSLFMPLAKLAAKERPDIRFLVVQSRGRWGNALGVLKFKPEDFPNVKVIGHQRDMRPVYASTRALLLPSLWHESGARVIAEAQINGIPILASNTGGSAELVGKGGIIFDVPEAVREKRMEPAPEDAVRPWLEAIAKVWDDRAYYEDLCRKVEREAVQHDLGRNTQRFIDAVKPAVLRGRGLGAQIMPLQPAGSPASGTVQVLQHALQAKQAKARRQHKKKR